MKRITIISAVVVGAFFAPAIAHNVAFILHGVLGLAGAAIVIGMVAGTFLGLLAPWLMKDAPMAIRLVASVSCAGLIAIFIWTTMHPPTKWVTMHERTVREQSDQQPADQDED